MKRYFLIFVLLNIVVFNTNAQIRINIDSLEISRVSLIYIPPPFVIFSFPDFWRLGPDAIFHLSITNTTDTFVPINYHEWIFGYFYSYQGRTYNSDFFSFELLATPEPFLRVLLIPEETFSFILTDNALLDLDVRRNKKDDDYDFSKEMLEILPTIRVYAISPDRQIFFSDQPQQIVIKKKEDNEEGYKDVLNVKKFLKKLYKTSIKYSRH